MENRLSRAKKSSIWLAIAVAAVATFEGVRYQAYRDITGIPTICYGETRGVRMGDARTLEQCDEELSAGLVEFNEGVNSCVKVPLPDTRRAAFVSLAWNIGTAAFCKSTVVKRINAGDIAGACEAILMWNRAGGAVVQGLINRRVKEREMCLRES